MKKKPRHPSKTNFRIEPPAGEPRIPLKEVVGLIPVPIAVSTIRKWARYGIETVACSTRLESVQYGGNVYTTKRAVERFLRKTNAIG